MIAALVLARLRRRPGRVVLPCLGIAVAVAFACAVAGEATIAGDRAARAALVGAGPVRVSARTIPARPVAAALARPWLGSVTRSVLFESLRLGGALVRLAAIAPLDRWSPGASTPPCAEACPLLAAGGAPPHGPLRFGGLRVAGSAQLDSPVPLGFRPLPAAAYAAGEPAAAGLLLSGDVDGLARRPALASFYRTTTWLAQLRPLHSWDLAAIERSLQRDQADLASVDPSLTFAAPFAALDAARAGTAAAPRRLVLAGGGAAAVLIAFVLLAAAALRRDLASERERLRVAGATPAQHALLVGLEAAAVSALGALAGAAAGVAVVAGLAMLAGEPTGAVLDHTLAGRLLDLTGGWALGTLLLCVALVLDLPALALDLLAVAAAGALAVALAGDPPVVLLAPLYFLAAGLIVLRACGLLLRVGERAARAGALRLALVNLARAPAAAAGAAAFLTISVGLGVFALAYAATLDRGAADQAASEVPLDVSVAAGPSFAGPLTLAPPARWRAIAGGPVLAVRRTAASFASGAVTATVPLLALPAAGLPLLALPAGGLPLLPAVPDDRGLIPPGPVRTDGPAIPPGAVGLRVRARAVGVGVGLRAALRSRAGEETTVSLGALGASARARHARLPAGADRLEALLLDEPAGLAATIGHQSAESPAPPVTGPRAAVTVLSVEAIGPGGRSLGRLAVSGWRAHGAASAPRPPGLTVDFDAGAATGVLRPPQPGDVAALPILVDPSTAAAAGRGGRLALSVDGVAIAARVVGATRRFPTVGDRFVVADEAAVQARLDAALPGDGRPDELWLAAPDLARTRAALADRRLAALTVAYRADVARRLRSDPVFVGVARTLRLAALVAVLLAAAGLVTTLVGGRDRLLERDLAAQGMGPRALRRELRLRLLVTATLGLAGGLAAGVALSRLAVAAVRGSPVGPPLSVPLVAVVPWPALELLGLVTAAGLGAVCWAATRRVG